MSDQQSFNEGELIITLDATGVYPVKIQSTRPLQVSRLFIGKTVDEVGDMVPLLYNVCATAQAHTSLLALNRARAQPLNHHVEIARAMLVYTESIREHLLRLCLDWPALFNIKFDSTLLPSIMQLVPSMTNALFDPAGAFNNHSALRLNHSALSMLLQDIETMINQVVTAMPLQQWLSMTDSDELVNWSNKRQTLAACAIERVLQQGWSGFGQSPVIPLPELNDEQLIRKLKSNSVEGFIQSPTWDNLVCETDPFTRQQSHPLIQSLIEQYGNGLLPRLVARLVELVSLPDRILVLLERIYANERTRAIPDNGLAQVEAARGRLVHYAEVANDRVEFYQILAPTEWNFHPRGVMTLSLEQLLEDTDTQQEQIARCLINAIDPCVGYQLSIL